MGLEIERKFLVKNDLWRNSTNNGTAFKQAYFPGSGNSSIRVRIEGNEANLNIKSATPGIIRQEFEYPIPLSDAEELLTKFCSTAVTKKRYELVHSGMTWEIDVFSQDNEGLIVAEIELSHPDESFDYPAWLGEEVSNDLRYYNTALSRRPYKLW